MTLDLMDIISEYSFAKNNNDIEELKMKKLISKNLNTRIEQSNFNFEKLPINPTLCGEWLHKLHEYIESSKTKVLINESKYAKQKGYNIFKCYLIKLKKGSNVLTFTFTTPFDATSDNKSSIDSSFFVKWIENNDKTIYTTKTTETKNGHFLEKHLEFENWIQKELGDIKKIQENNFDLKKNSKLINKYKNKGISK